MMIENYLDKKKILPHHVDVSRHHSGYGKLLHSLHAGSLGPKLYT